MNLLTILIIFVVLNIDTFIALLFILRNYRYRLPIIAFGTATVILWGFGVIFGKTLAFIFPNWITGFMGIILILLAVFNQGDDKKNANTNFSSLFLFCLSLGGDNLAVYIPWAVDLTVSEIIYIGFIFTGCSVLLILLGKGITSAGPIAKLLGKYGSYGSKIIYILAGLYIIWNSRLISHIWLLFN